MLLHSDLLYICPQLSREILVIGKKYFNWHWDKCIKNKRLLKETPILAQERLSNFVRIGFSEKLTSAIYYFLVFLTDFSKKNYLTSVSSTNAVISRLLAI